MQRAAILVVDDEQPFRDVLCGVLRKQGHKVDGTGSAEDGLALAEKKGYDLVVCDLRLPAMSGLDLLRALREKAPDVRFIMITAYGDIETAVEAVKLGAVDYLTKPFLFDDIVLRIERLLEHLTLEQSHAALQDELVARYEPRGFVGNSPAILKVRELMRRVAPTNSNVLIIGESGTGKEVVARAIHRMGERGERRLVTLNCAALPDTLLESELFGHSKGAFTGASRSNEGHFLAADGGTLFLDEIGAMPISLQSKILRAVESREILPLGSTTPRKVDVRIVAATNADLRKLVQENRFREDLYYRLDVITVPLPPLRERKEDIPLLVEHFLKRYSEENKRDGLTFSSEAMKMMMDFDWPGNVRELENAVERAVVLSSGSDLGPQLLPEQLSQDGSHAARPITAEVVEGRALFEIMESYERRIILDMLSRTNWSQTEAAERFRVPLSTLNQKIRRLQIDIKRRREA